jgi:hypothetical protein
VGRVADGWGVYARVGRGRVVPSLPRPPARPPAPSSQSPLSPQCPPSPLSTQSPPESLGTPSTHSRISTQFPDSPQSHVSPESVQSACGQYREVRLIIRRFTESVPEYHMWGEKSDETDETDRRRVSLYLCLSGRVVSTCPASEIRTQSGCPVCDAIHGLLTAAHRVRLSRATGRPQDR